MDDDFSWFGGDDSYIDNSDSGSSGGDWNASDTDANSPWATGDSGSGNSLLGGGSSGTGGGSSTGGSTDWTKWLASAGLSAASGYLSGEANEKLLAEKTKAAMELMKASKAEDEKYYQLHGQQLKDAYSGYAKYYHAPQDHGKDNPTSLFGLLTPQTSPVKAVDGFAYDQPPMAAPQVPSPLLTPYDHSTRPYMGGY